jgi:hypothetical protein
MIEESIEEPPLRHEADAHRLGLDFRLDGGPIFNRGPLDGSARLLIIRQDLAQHKTIVAKLGFTRGYGFINTYLCSASVAHPSKPESSSKGVGQACRYDQTNAPEC